MFRGNYSWSLPRIKPAITLAVDDILATSNSSSGRVLGFRINYGDSKCSETMGPLAAIDMYLERRADVFIGPACDYAVSPLARFSPHWNIPVVTGTFLRVTRRTSSWCLEHPRGDERHPGVWNTPVVTNVILVTGTFLRVTRRTSPCCLEHSHDSWDITPCEWKNIILESDHPLGARNIPPCE